jgi:hypothetical protein
MCIILRNSTGKSRLLCGVEGRTAHVGVGISGVEGLQAASASDYAIAQVNLGS